MRLVWALLAVVVASALFVQPAAAQDGTALVRSVLVSDASAVAPGGSATLAIALDVTPGWHVYWRNPGDAGLAPSVDWHLPRGVAVGGFAWPVPERSVTSTVGSYVYNGEVTLLAPLRVAANAPASGALPIRGSLSWLVCKNVCIPGHREIATTIRFARRTSLDPAQTSLFRAARTAIPAPGPFATTFAIAGDRVRIAVPSSAYEHRTVSAATFFPTDQNLVAHAVPEQLSQSGDGIVIGLARSQIPDRPRTVDGDLVIDTRVAGGPPQRFVYAVSAKPGPVPEMQFTPAASAPADALGILTALGLAFVGGLILNVMPCVFPVLSLKAMALVREPAADRKHETLAFAAGVVASALVLGTVILALRGTTAALGWGFQLQSPSFVAYLALIIFVLGLAMSGVAELTLIVPQFLTRVHRTGAIASAIADGVLVTLIGSSCTVPFMGAALGYALTAPPLAALAVFAALGLGLATPFALVSLVPAIARRIPKPGRWTETARHLLAFPLYATLAWLAWVFAREAPDALPAFLAALLAAAFAMWLLGAAQRSATRASTFARGLAVAVVAFAAIVVSPALVRPQSGVANAADGYETFTPQRLAQLRASHRRAFVDLTAAWCVTCQVNERVALDRPDVRQRFADLRVVALRGDWTTQNPAITAYLQSFGHSGVPLYVYYDADGSVHVLPQILTPSTVLDVVKPLTTAQTGGPS